MQLRAHRQARRPGAAVVELAVLLPLFVFLFVIGVDFARVFYHSVTVTNAARSGALFASRDEVRAADTAGIENAVREDAKNLSPPPTVGSVRDLDALGHPCIKVTVTWTFKTVSLFPGVPNTVALSRTVQMRIAPTVPKETS